MSDFWGKQTAKMSFYLTVGVLQQKDSFGEFVFAGYFAANDTIYGSVDSNEIETVTFQYYAYPDSYYELWSISFKNHINYNGDTITIEKVGSFKLTKLETVNQYWVEANESDTRKLASLEGQKLLVTIN